MIRYRYLNYSHRQNRRPDNQTTWSLIATGISLNFSVPEDRLIESPQLRKKWSLKALDPIRFHELVKSHVQVSHLFLCLTHWVYIYYICYIGPIFMGRASFVRPYYAAVPRGWLPSTCFMKNIHFQSDFHFWLFPHGEVDHGDLWRE